MDKTKASKKSAPILATRRVLGGVRVMASGIALPKAYLVYEEYFSDGSKKIVQGNPIFGVPLPGEHNEAVRPDLFELMHACAILQQRLENACYNLDNKRMKKPANCK